jgi:hypothetical protein
MIHLSGTVRTVDMGPSNGWAGLYSQPPDRARGEEAMSQRQKSKQRQLQVLSEDLPLPQDATRV